jgi:hypothetical protein
MFIHDRLTTTNGIQEGKKTLLLLYHKNVLVNNLLWYSQVPQTQTSFSLGFPEVYIHIQETVHRSAAGFAPLGDLPVLK